MKKILQKVILILTPLKGSRHNFSEFKQYSSKTDHFRRFFRFFISAANKRTKIHEKKYEVELTELGFVENSTLNICIRENHTENYDKNLKFKTHSHNLSKNDQNNKSFLETNSNQINKEIRYYNQEEILIKDKYSGLSDSLPSNFKPPYSQHNDCAEKDKNFIEFKNIPSDGNCLFAA